MARKTTATAPAPEKVSTPEGANEFDLERISVTASVNNVAEDDLFSDLSKIRIDPGYVVTAKTEKLILKVPVGIPRYPKYFRVHPTYQVDTVLVEVKDQQQPWFFPTPDMRVMLEGFTKSCRLFLAVTRQDTYYIVPARLPDPDNALTRTWAESCLHCLEQCRTGWYNMRGNSEVSGYDLRPAGGPLPDPKWPTMTFPELLRIAFRDLTIRDDKHQIYRELFGLP